jgi:hypothetical protein
MLRLEIPEGKEAISHTDYKARPSNFDELYLEMSTGDIHKYRTAVTLRLTRHLKDRVVVGDDAFSSVELVEALLERGLNYVGTKKMASAGYPYEYLRDETMNLQPGEHITATTNVRLHNGEEREILSLGYKISESHRYHY